MSALTDKLQEKKQKQTCVWHPAAAGEVTEGKVVLIGETITANGDAKFAEIETATGKMTVFLSSVLQKQFDMEKVEEGDTIAIEFMGEVKSSKSKRVYKNYVVVKGD